MTIRICGDEWMKVKLTEICTPKQWKTIPTNELLGQGYPVYGANGIIGYYNEYNHENSVVTITCRGATCGTINITEPKSYITGNAMCLDNLQSGILLEYLYYCLLHYDFRNVISGSAQPQITRQGLEKVEIEISSIEEQKKRITTLNKINVVIAACQQQLQKLDDLVKARFVELFGDPKKNPFNYPTCRLSEYIEFLTSGSRGWAQYCVDDGEEWFITIKNVKDCHISIENMQPVNAPDNAEARRTKVQEGDLLISITADLGRTGVVTKEIAEHGAYINQHLTCIRLNKEVLNPLYVAYFMEGSAGKEQFELKNQSAVKAGLNFNSINSLQLMVPPLEKQMAFFDFVTQIDKSKAVVQKTLGKAQLLFDSLMQQYFS